MWLSNTLFSGRDRSILHVRSVWLYDGWPIVVLLMVTWTLIVGRLAVGQHDSFYNPGNDLGIYTQVIWSTSQGRPFQTSLLTDSTTFLGHHFSPILAALAPLYMIVPDARLLLWVQAIALAVAVLPLYAFALRRVGLGLGLLVVVCYFLSPLPAFVARHEFHEIALAVPILMAGLVALLERRYRAMAIWLVLGVMVKEEVAIIAVGFGLYIALVQRRFRLGLAFFVGASLLSLLLLGLIIPSLSQGTGSYTFFNRYASLGTTPQEMLKTLITEPQTVLRVFSSEDKRTFLLVLFLPLAGLPLLALPVILLALPTLGYLLLSDYDLQTKFWSYYSAPLIPFLFIGTVVVLERLHRTHRILAVAAAVSLLITCLWGWRNWSPLPGGRFYHPERAQVGLSDHATAKLLSSIPSDAVVASDWRYFPWLANRSHLYNVVRPIFANGESGTDIDWIVTEDQGSTAVLPPRYPWLVPTPEEGSVLRIPRFELFEMVTGGAVIWKRRSPSDDVTLRRLDIPFDLGLNLVASGMPPASPLWGPIVQGNAGMTLPVWLAFGADIPLEQRITFFLHLVDQDGQLVAQVDREMNGGVFPTNLWHTWVSDPVVVDEFPLRLPDDLSPGRYRLLAGAYETESFRNIPMTDGSQMVELATIEIGQ